MSLISVLFSRRSLYSRTSNFLGKHLGILPYFLLKSVDKQQTYNCFSVLCRIYKNLSNVDSFPPSARLSPLLPTSLHNAFWAKVLFEGSLCQGFNRSFQPRKTCSQSIPGKFCRIHVRQKKQVSKFAPLNGCIYEQTSSKETFLTDFQRNRQFISISERQKFDQNFQLQIHKAQLSSAFSSPSINRMNLIPSTKKAITLYNNSNRREYFPSVLIGAVQLLINTAGTELMSTTSSLY